MSKPKKTVATAIDATRITNSVRFAPNPLPQLTPRNLANYLDSFAKGYLRDTAILWDAIQRRDDRVASDSLKRCKGIARYGYTIEYADGVDPQSPAAKRHSDAIKFALENLTAGDVLERDIRGGVTMLCRQMLRAVGNQYQVHELVWKVLPGGITLDATAMPLWWFERTTGELRFLAQDLAIEGLPLEPEGWMLTRGDGLMAATSMLYLLKRMSLTDWALYNGRVGPGIHAKTPASKGSDEWKDVEDAVNNFDFDLKIVTGDGVSIDPIEMALKGTLPWPELYKAMQTAITILWRGGNLLSDSGGTPDQTGVTLQGAERDSLEQDDAEAVSDALNDYIVTPVIRYRFDEDPLAWVKWNTGAKPNLAPDLATDKQLYEMQYPLTQEYLAEKYGRPLPQKGQTVLARPAPIAPGASPFSAANAVSPSPSLPVPASSLESARRQIVAAAIDESAAAEAAIISNWFASLQTIADTAKTESDFLTAIEDLVRKMPTALLTNENIARLAAPLEGAIGATILNTIATAKRPDPSNSSDPSNHWVTDDE